MSPRRLASRRAFLREALASLDNPPRRVNRPAARKVTL